MRFIAVLMPLALVAAAPPGDASAIQPICDKNAIPRVDTSARPPRLHVLGDEPPARHILGVVRTIDGCARPTVVRAEIGPRR